VEPWEKVRGKLVSYKLSHSLGKVNDATMKSAGPHHFHRFFERNCLQIKFQGLRPFLVRFLLKILVWVLYPPIAVLAQQIARQNSQA
jgi:hypothetical protein